MLLVRCNARSKIMVILIVRLGKSSIAIRQVVCLIVGSRISGVYGEMISCFISLRKSSYSMDEKMSLNVSSNCW